ncbi:MAG: hypothetical protein WBN48_15920, partial [Thiogranum sp.]
NLAIGNGQGIYAAPCDEDSGFSIANVDPGNYTLTIFDANLDVVIGFVSLTVDANGTDCDGGVITGCNYGDVGVFNWFTRLNTGIFNDDDQDGFWDPNEIGIGPESQDVSLRWRDGTIYQNFPTDNEGFAPFDETFPFFHWLVAEVSFANKKATGVTYVIDGGGEVPADAGWAMPSFDELTPQAQCEPVDPVNDPDGPTVGYDPVTLTCPPGTEAVNINTGNNLSRTEAGPSLTTGFQGFLGQTSVMQFGKTDYVGFDFSTPMPTFVGENGGISGIVFNTVTRAEDEPQFAAAEEWEPGVPRVQVNLYADGDIDSFPLGDFPNGFGDIDWENTPLVLNGDDNIIDDINGDGCVTFADVDNAPLGWADGSAPKGAEDIDHLALDSATRDPVTGQCDPLPAAIPNGIFDYGDAVQVTWTDSWDDSLPTGCQGETFFKFGEETLPTDCYDGLRNFNQIRPAVFDGGYAFTDYDMANLTSVNPAAATAIQKFYDRLELGDPADPIMMPGVPNFDLLQLGLLPGDYIVEAAAPSGFEHIKEEDRNVDFGDEYIPSPEALPVACVGDDHEVPPLFSMLTKDGSGLIAEAIPGVDTLDPGNAAPFAGDMRPLCDRKKVPLSSGQNAAAEYFLMTDVPVAANVSGIMLNDLANEFDPNAPAFSEKFAPPWLPVAFYDWNGAEVNRVYADEFGRFNAMVASTFTANIGMPSGMSPNMLQSCMNDAGAVPDGQGGFTLDPFYDPSYSQFCYTFQYMPGSVTYLDTPVVSVAAFANVYEFPLDCEQPTQTPVISTVNRAAVSGGGGPFALAGQQIEIHSMGLTEVPNPEWEGPEDMGNRTIDRDYSFICGGLANAELEAVNGTRTALGSINCSAAQIDGIVPAVGPGDYQVVVTGSDGTESPIGVTLTVGTAEGVGQRPDGNPYAVSSVVPGPGGPIQAAIDAAAPGDLILVAPGSYDEMVIMWKPVKLQGWGAGDTFINARQVPSEKLTAWRAKTAALVTNVPPLASQLPGQQAGLPGFPALDEGSFPTEEGTAIFVLALAPDPSNPDPKEYGLLANQGARIDGFTIVGSSNGGGIVVNGYAQDLLIGNNRLTGNAGIYGGGIRVGHPALSHVIEDPADPLGDIGDIVYDDATNDRIRIHHNQVIKNGGQGGAGGGISLNTGADDYQVDNNWVCGNFTQGDGAGIGHLGLSDNGLMEDNVVAFNESFSQGNDVDGGGIFIGGQPDLMPDATVMPPLALTPGTGNVIVDANLLRGNLAGAGDGGGISIRMVNGEDVNQSPADTGPWWAISLYNNGINNNVAALAGGGIVLRDALK